MISAFGVDHGGEVAKRGKWTKQDTKNVAYLGAGGVAGGVAGRRLTRGSRLGTAAGAGLGVMGGASLAGRKHAKAFNRQYKRTGPGKWEHRKTGESAEKLADRTYGKQ